MFKGKKYRYFFCGIFKQRDEKELNQELFNKLYKIDGNLHDDYDHTCPYWKEIEGVSSDDTLPIWCFTAPDRFVKRIEELMLDLSKAIDKVLASD